MLTSHCGPTFLIQILCVTVAMNGIQFYQRAGTLFLVKVSLCVSDSHRLMFNLPIMWYELEGPVGACAFSQWSKRGDMGLWGCPTSSAYSFLES